MNANYPSKLVLRCAHTFRPVEDGSLSTFQCMTTQTTCSNPCEGLLAQVLLCTRQIESLLRTEYISQAINNTKSTEDDSSVNDNASYCCWPTRTHLLMILCHIYCHRPTLLQYKLLFLHVSVNYCC